MAEHPLTPRPQLRHNTTAEVKDDSNLCRICRGEATEQEPLYHPCKCSGSIMYVHQDCLMEWLSHSQKKHCELCKTSFQFTKLYSPDMPERLPLGIFFRKAAVHTAQNVLSWLRGGLVASTWAIWLPWTMRFVWWGLFWLADVTWVKNSHAVSPNGTLVETETLTTNASVPQLNSTAGDLNLALLGEVLKGQTIIRVTSYLIRSLFSTPGKGVLNDLTPENHMQSYVFAGNSTRVAERGTLLSGVSFLNSLTPSILINRVVIDVLEGQIITLALVALIILVLLIREWVVQQQPIANVVNENDEVRQALRRHAREGERQRPQRPNQGRRRTSTILREPDAFVKGILEEQEEEQDNASQPDLEKAQEVYIKDLHRRALALRSAFKDEFHGLADQPEKPDIGDILRDIKDTHQALRVAYAIAVQHEDLSRLRSLRTGLRIYRRTLALLPCQLTASIKDSTDELKASMKSMVRMVKLKVSMNGLVQLRNAPATQDTESHARHRPRASSTTLQESSEREHTPTGRPIMPPRDASFVATNIQRDLEEGTSSKDDNDNTAADPTSHDPQEATTPSLPDEENVSDTDSYENVEQMADEIITESVDAPTNGTKSQVDHSVPSVNEPMTAGVTADTAPVHPSPIADNDITATGGTVPASDTSLRASDPDNSSNLDRSGNEERGHSATGHDVEAVRESFADRARGWLWGDFEPVQNEEPRLEGGDNLEAGADELAEPAVEVLAHEHLQNQDDIAATAEAPENLPQNENEAVEQAQAQAQAQAAGLFGDVDGMDDAEDLEGVMELIGMQGPLTNLFTNALFAAVFVSCTIVISIWIPFLLGKVALIILAHPISMIEMPMVIITHFSNVLYDMGVLMTASIFQWLFLNPVMLLFNSSSHEWLPASMTRSSFWPNLDVSTADLISRSANRLMETLRSTVQGTNFAYSALTYDSHSAVRALEALVSRAGHYCGQVFARASRLSLNSLTNMSTTCSVLKDLGTDLDSYVRRVANWSSQLPAFVVSGDYTITYEAPDFSQGLADAAPQWTASDRSLAIGLGYALIAVLGGFYYMRLAPLAKSRHNKKIEHTIIEILQQAGGITKVVLIISIEMLIFPLYCGVLLDIAMIPLFQDASVTARFDWSKQAPWTSLFVHWFLGTAYMFHFALFVAMCRKIFRKGVLYFIRDPDDPTFHPVRDVLDRSVVSQLRKILSSALIYGGLVIVCIGTLVWSLAYTLRGTLPIQWKSTSSANTFPLDLVVYIFLRPLAVKHFALSEWLQDFYKEFLKRSAQYFRLTHFLFGEEKETERGPIERRGFAMQPSNGKWLRVPAHDGVRLPRGISAFVDVDQDGRRLNGSAEPEYRTGTNFREEDHLKVFVPHYFGLHLIAFVGSLWTVTALIGITFTILPLLLGRLVLIPVFQGDAINDIHSFAMGISMVCSAISISIQARNVAIEKNFFADANDATSPAKMLSRRTKWMNILVVMCGTMKQHGPQMIRCCYVYGLLGLIGSIIFSTILHLYILGPAATLSHATEMPHVVRISESLVIGMQLVRSVGVIVRDHDEWRIKRALDAVLEDGEWNPKAVLATRYILLPCLLVSSIIIFVPAVLGQIAIRSLGYSDDLNLSRRVQVFAYPAILGVLICIWVAHLLVRATSRWRMRIRDEVFLIGERLHNFGEKRPPANAPHTTARIVS